MSLKAPASDLKQDIPSRVQLILAHEERFLHMNDLGSCTARKHINIIKTIRYYYCLWNATMGVLEACYLLVNRMLVTRFWRPRSLQTRFWSRRPARFLTTAICYIKPGKGEQAKTKRDSQNPFKKHDHVELLENVRHVYQYCRNIFSCSPPPPPSVLKNHRPV